MEILIFNGAFDKRSSSTSQQLVDRLSGLLKENGCTVTHYNLAEGSIPLFDITLKSIPVSVSIMLQQFRAANNHIWITPLYHGGMTGVMKNCLDWIEMSSKSSPPYLTDKIVGLVCYADGGMAMQAINEMDDVAKALRAWPLPFSIPIVKGGLYKDKEKGIFTEEYFNKFNLMVKLISTKEIKTNSLPFCKNQKGSDE